MAQPINNKKNGKTKEPEIKVETEEERFTPEQIKRIDELFVIYKLKKQQQLKWEQYDKKQDRLNNLRKELANTTDVQERKIIGKEIRHLERVLLTGKI